MNGEIALSKSKREKKNKKSGFHIFTKLIVIVMLLGCIFGYFTYRNGGGLKGILATMLFQTPEKLENVQPITVLLLRYKPRFKF